ncbi:MAG: D-alanyl-D-alanine carboxypeptidase/D-alanyl-D-alanine-endopeptidase [Longimicrobiales bacterium]
MRSNSWRRLPALCLALALAAQTDGVAAQNTEPGAPSAPGAVLDSILHSAPLSRAHWGVAVYDRADGSPVLLHNEGRLFTAASTMKLVTAAAALDLLGAEYRFRTDVVGEWGPDGVADRLTVEGGGDPSLTDAFFDHPLAPLDSLADSLAAAGLRRVVGPLVIDQTRFDSVAIFPAWETFDLDWYYAAPVAPFAVMAASYEVIVTPDPRYGPAQVATPHAAGLVGIDAGIRTVSGGDDWDDALRRLPEADSLVLRGTIGVDAGPDTSWIAQTRPGHTAGRAFQVALERAGIQVDRPVVVRYTPNPEADAGPGARTVSWRSPPLVAIMRVALERSDNWITEQVVKTMAARLVGLGTWSGGRLMVSRFLTRDVGIPEDAYYLRDGSGLSPQGLLTPEAVTALLRYVDEQPWSVAYRDALARPGEPESTLEDRLLQYGDRVLGKTGTLRHVNALSGYLVTRSGRELVFSILSNGSGRPSWEVQAAVDRIVESLIEDRS